MHKSYDLLVNLLNDIEDGLKNDLKTSSLAVNYSMSLTHLRRLFQFAFNQTLGSYIRSRKLSSSIEDLVNSNLNILDIAILYGFEYEQTYIRSFKREFGITPGDLRKTGQIIKIKPPLHLFDSNRLEGSVFFGPDIVMVPQFNVIGKKHKMPLNCELSSLPAKHFHNFINNDKDKIFNAKSSEKIINVSTKSEEANADFGYFMPSVHVKTLDNIPDGFSGFYFPSTLCVRFRIIKSDDNKFDNKLAEKLFSNINNFIKNNNQKYIIDRDKITIDILDPSSFGGNYNLWEWFTPIKLSASPKP